MMIFFPQGSSFIDGASLERMQENASLYITQRKENLNPIQVEAQVPLWMKQNGDGYNNPSFMIHFLKYYYDWMANDYGYESVNIFDLAKLADIYETPDFLLPNFIKTYGIDLYGLYGLTGDKAPSTYEIRRTLDSIRKEVYQRKSTEIAYKSLMSSLFGINDFYVTIKYPKRKLMRLNSGVFSWMSNGMNPQSASLLGSTGEYSNERFTLVGSYLNQGVLQDGKMWQDYSYIIDSPVDDSDPYYEDILKQALHPAGLLGFFEQTERFEETSAGDVNSYYDYEMPMIANYYPYTLGSFESLPFCTGCTSSYPLFRTGWTFPTFVYPTWADEIVLRGVTKPFGNILVSDFIFRLSTTATGGSPNDDIGTECVYCCGSTGTVSFSWTVYRNSLPYVGITGINVNERVYFTNESSFGFNRYFWQFGDGTTSAAENPNKAYSSTGIFGVTLTAYKDAISYQLSLRGATFYVT
jgi:hypothetical protein